MDKSKRYIAMCAAAAEIQKLWPRTYGDFYAMGDGRIECWLPQRHARRCIRQGFEVCRDGEVTRLTPFTWLPRQAQLIELAQVPGRRYDQTTQDYFNWAKSPYRTSDDLPVRLFDSMEKLWLAYVMDRRFFKRWDGEGWVRSLQR